MKSLTCFTSLFILTIHLSYAQRMGLNTTSPSAPIHMVQPTGTTLVGTQPVLFTEYTGTNLADAIAIKGKCKPGDYYGLGGDFEGGYIGVQGRITGGLNQNYVGVKGDVAGTGTGDFFGIYGSAHASGDNYGVYGTATGGAKNWAGYFANGNVHIQNRFAIGNTNPQHPVHINQPSGTVITGNYPVMHVEYTGTNIDDVIAIRGRCSLPSSKGIGGQFEGGEVGVRGKINTSAGGAHFAVQGMVDANNGTNIAIFGDANGFEAINYAGYFGNGMVYIDDNLGVGRDPETNRLEVNGNASKSSAGDWIANSDERLKKNIQPLDEMQMIQKLLALKGITYEWNDDKTGNDRPEGIQYGFSAQNIQEVFPTLVEEDANGYLQTAYGTYDAMTIEAIRYLYMENQQLKEEIKEIRQMLGTANAKN
jgi:hypothetical protein